VWRDSVAHQHLAEKFTGYAPRLAGEEGASEGADRWVRGTWQGHKSRAPELSPRILVVILRCHLKLPS
jgi:hypothetical protein